MIVRDEARCIERCLHSAAPYVDRILVLDTGSRDNTVALARACGAEVHQMAWPGSFASARNRALELADADWNLILDGDEWIESGGASLRDSICQARELGVVQIQSAFSSGASTQVSIDWITRLLPRGVRYVGAIHEQPDAALPRRRLQLVIGHDGYQPDAMQAKKGRNRDLLQAMLEEAGGQDAYLSFQLGKDFEAYGELAKAAEAYQRSLVDVPLSASIRTSIAVRAIHCLGKSGRLAQAMDLATEHLDAMKDSPDCFFTLGDLCLDAAVAHPLDAMGEWLPMAQAAWLRCLEIGERPEQSGSVVGRGSYLAAHNLYVVHEGMGQPSVAAHYLELSQEMRRSAPRMSAQMPEQERAPS
jgi:tetratricopeptide (TPR) repeat protein